jgi:hypothetical protein
MPLLGIAETLNRQLVALPQQFYPPDEPVIHLLGSAFTVDLVR